jgi:hypothetical protein
MLNRAKKNMLLPCDKEETRTQIHATYYSTDYASNTCVSDCLTAKAAGKDNNGAAEIALLRVAGHIGNTGVNERHITIKHP